MKIRYVLELRIRNGEGGLYDVLFSYVSNVLSNVTGCMFAIVRFNSFAQFYGVK